MKTKIDLKSLLIGLLVGVVAILVVAAESPSNQTGRYQITGSLNYFMILDTQTGKVWTENLPANSSRANSVGKDSDPDFFTAK